MRPAFFYGMELVDHDKLCAEVSADAAGMEADEQSIPAPIMNGPLCFT